MDVAALGKGGVSLWGDHPCLPFPSITLHHYPSLPPPRPHTRTCGAAKAGGGETRPGCSLSSSLCMHILLQQHPHSISLWTSPHQPTSTSSIVPVTRALKAGVTPADTTGPEPTDNDMPTITMETLPEKHPDAREEAAWVRGRERRKK